MIVKEIQVSTYQNKILNNRLGNLEDESAREFLGREVPNFVMRLHEIGFRFSNKNPCIIWRGNLIIWFQSVANNMEIFKEEEDNQHEHKILIESVSDCIGIVAQSQKKDEGCEPLMAH